MICIAALYPHGHAHCSIDIPMWHYVPIEMSMGVNLSRGHNAIETV